MVAAPAAGGEGHAARTRGETAAPRPMPVLADVAREARGPKSHFGPSGCVSTYLGPSETCVVETRCAGVDMSGFEYTVVCVDADGSPVRHCFGPDSFDAEETFDTEILCKRCFGPEDVPQVVQLAGNVDVLASNMAKMASKVHFLQHEVERITGQTIEVEPTSAPAATSDVEPEVEPLSAPAPHAFELAPAPATRPSLRSN